MKERENKLNRILFATGNEGKMKEIRKILDEYGIEAISLKEAGINPDIDENGTTFEENALIKAREISVLTGETAMADDSGLEVDYLDKQPGVFSARFMGEDTSYDIKNAFIMNKLEGIPEEQRTARFVCAIACVFPDGRNVVVRDTIEGVIAHEAAGENGFGYDPIFYVPEYGCTTAELTMEQKNKISHRAKAVRKAMDILVDAKMITF